MSLVHWETKSDDLLLKKFISEHKKTPDCFSVPKMTNDKFIVFHTAKEVEYTIAGFRIKNKDEIPRELDKCIKNSSDKNII